MDVIQTETRDFFRKRLGEGGAKLKSSEVEKLKSTEPFNLQPFNLSTGKVVELPDLFVFVDEYRAMGGALALYEAFINVPHQGFKYDVTQQLELKGALWDVLKDDDLVEKVYAILEAQEGE